MTKRILVFYHFHPKDEAYLDNLAHFLLFGYTENADFVVILSGANQIPLPTRPNIRYLYTENHNYDFGGYAHALATIHPLQNYEYFLFVNSSVRGPFTIGEARTDWIERLIQPMRNSNIGMVGSTINILPAHSLHAQSYQLAFPERAPPYAHVQTMAYALNKRSLDYLLGIGFYNLQAARSKNEIVEHYEIRLSQLLLARGWNIACLLPEYQGMDFRTGKDIWANQNPTALEGDCNFPGAYFGRNPHPFETLFIKTHRKIYTLDYLLRLAYSQWLAQSPPINGQDSAIVGNYIDRIKAVATHAHPVAMMDIEITAEEILYCNKILLQQQPDFAAALRQLLTQPIATEK